MNKIESGSALFTSYAESLHRGRNFAVTHNATLSQRMVWFAAISGFVLLNGRDQWADLSGGVLTTASFLALVLPWAATAVGAVLTHLFMSELDMADAKFYSAKMAAIEVFAIRFSEGKRELEAFDEILGDRDPRLAILVGGVKKWHIWVTRSERFTVVSLAVSFVWAIAGPFIL